MGSIVQHMLAEPKCEALALQHRKALACVGLSVPTRVVALLPSVQHSAFLQNISHLPENYV